MKTSIKMSNEPVWIYMTCLQLHGLRQQRHFHTIHTEVIILFTTIVKGYNPKMTVLK